MPLHTAMDKTKKMGLGPFGMMVIIIGILLVLGGILYSGGFTKNNTKKEPSALMQLFGNPDPATSLEPSPTEAIDMSAWITYQNDKWKFNITYPESWEAYLYEDRVSIAPSSDQSLGSFEIIFENLKDIPGYPDIWQDTQGYAESLKESFHEVTIGDYQWLELVRNSNAETFSRELFLIKDGRLVQLSLFGFSKSGEISNILNHILSTFKFIK